LCLNPPPVCKCYFGTTSLSKKHVFWQTGPGGVHSGRRIRLRKRISGFESGQGSFFGGGGWGWGLRGVWSVTKNNCSLWGKLPCDWEVKGHCKEMPVIFVN
jgi:hypothetical protein